MLCRSAALGAIDSDANNLIKKYRAEGAPTAYMSSFTSEIIPSSEEGPWEPLVH